MQEFSAEVVGGEVEGVGLDFFGGEGQLLVDEGLDGVEPVAVVPDVEVLLVLQQEHLGQLLLSPDDLWVDGEESPHQPLPIAPDGVGFGVGLDELGGQLDLSSQQLGSLLDPLSLYRLLDQLSSEVEDGGDVRDDLHEEGDELQVFGDLLRAELAAGNGEELSQLLVDLEGELFLLLDFLLGFLAFVLLVAVDHIPTLWYK